MQLFMETNPILIKKLLFGASLMKNTDYLCKRRRKRIWFKSLQDPREKKEFDEKKRAGVFNALAMDKVKI